MCTRLAYSIDSLCHALHIVGGVSWEIEYTDEFERWWHELSNEERITLDAMIRVLEQHGAGLGAPYSVETEHPDVRQLRIPEGEGSLCVLYTIDDARRAFVLLLGVKGDDAVCPPAPVGEAGVAYQSYLKLRRRTPH
jgi:hypothetical protein